MHVERLGNDEVEGILVGNVYVQPKLDGANGQIYFDQESGGIFCASRRKMVDENNTNQGFYNYVVEHAGMYMDYFKKHPHHILYGEWLVPHTLKTYRKDAWRKFYVFDVFNNYSGMFIPYDKYVEELKEFEIPFVPVIAEFYNPPEKNVESYLEHNKFLIEDGKGLGEGIVIKNYDFINKYGRPTWAKIVRNEFKEEHNITMGHPEMSFEPVEIKIANEFVTEGRLSKIKEKIMTEKDTGWQSKYIPEYLGRVWFEIIQDEMWNILKKHKNPRINFRDLNRCVILKIKELDKETF
jgi:hypothetical protein